MLETAEATNSQKLWDSAVLSGTPAHIVGRIEVLSPFDSLQMFSQLSKYGILEFKRDDGLTASCAVVEGGVEDAHCGHLHGREALMTFLWWNRGWFVFESRPQLTPAYPPIRVPELLMDAVRLADEIELRNEHLPPRDKPLELCEGAEPLEDTLECDVGHVFNYLKDHPRATCEEMVRALPLAPVKVRLGVALLAESGRLRHPEAAAPCTLVEAEPIEWWHRLKERFPGGLRMLIAHSPAEPRDGLFRAVAKLGESLKLPNPTFSLAAEGPSFLRLRPAVGGILSATFLPISKKNRYLFESFVQSVQLVIICGTRGNGIEAESWVSVVPKTVRVISLERSDELADEVVSILWRLAEGE